MDMIWHANTHVQHSAKEEADHFGGGEQNDLKINKTITTNIHLRTLLFKI